MDCVSPDDLKKLSPKFRVMFALFCANQAKESWQDIPKYVEAIELIEKWLNTEDSCIEFRTASNLVNAIDPESVVACVLFTAVYTRHTNSIVASAHSAAFTSLAAIRAVARASVFNTFGNSAVDMQIAANAATEQQREYYGQLLEFDKIMELALLK